MAQVAGSALVVAGAANLDSDAGITLANSGNRFTGQVTLQAGGSSSLLSSQSLSLDAARVTGNLSLAATSGTLTATGAVVTTGTAVFNAGGAITLANGSNQFGGAVTVTGASLTLNTSGALAIGGTVSGQARITGNSSVNLNATSVGGTLALSSVGALSQTAGSALVVTGTTTLLAGDAASPSDLTLASTTNSFAGAVTAQGRAVQLGALGSLQIAATSSTALTLAASGSLTLAGTSAGTTASFSGASIQQLASGGLAVAGASSFAAPSGAITLTNTTNSFTGLVSIVGAQTLERTSASALRLSA
jgi:hypothetical protein